MKTSVPKIVRIKFKDKNIAPLTVHESPLSKGAKLAIEHIARIDRESPVTCVCLAAVTEANGYHRHLIPGESPADVAEALFSVEYLKSLIVG